MRIQSINNNFNHKRLTTPKNSPQFNAWEREVFKTPKNTFCKELKHRNNTGFFRDGNFWNYLTFFLLKKYNQIPKVNVYNYACSDGSEPYTFLMSIIAPFGLENAKKFLPIKAMDYDSTAIQRAKDNFYELRSDETSIMNTISNNQLDRYFDLYRGDNSIVGVPKKILTDQVKFSVSNILHDYKKIKPENSIVFARNFWPYLKEDSITLAKKLGSQMGENSTLVIGKYDIKGCEWNGIDIVQELVKNGFRKSEIDLVFEKKD